MKVVITLFRDDKPDQPVLKLSLPADRSGALKWYAQNPDCELVEITDSEIIRYLAFDFSFAPVIIRGLKWPKEWIEEEKSDVIPTGRKFRLER